MVGHQQIGITDLYINLECFDEVDITLVGVDLLEIIAVAPDIPEVHIEDLLPRAEIPDHLVNFLPGIVKHFRDCALAKVQTMIGALLDGDESLQPIHGAQHADQSLVAFGRHARIVGMARHPNLVLIGNGNHSLEEIGDSLPEHGGVHAPGLGERRIRMQHP